MATRSDLARQFMDLQRDGKTDDAVAMLADGVTASNPMTGMQNGKDAVEAGMRAQPPGGGGFNISWADPVEEGDSVTIVGTGSPFGPIKLVFGFDASNLIDRIEVGLA